MSDDSQIDTHTICLSNHYTERTRTHRQNEGLSHEIMATLLNETPNHSIYRFGSSIEETEIYIDDSDFDRIECFDEIPVINNLIDVQNTSHLVLMAIDCVASPGYVKLQVVLHGKPITGKYLEENIHFARDWLSVDCDGRVVFCYLPYKCNFMCKSTKNGPAVTLDNVKIFDNFTTIDFVVALRYKSWPLIAHEWISRKREHEWPSQTVIEKFKTLGYFMVKVGSPASAEPYLEWRISFSLQERELMFGLNNVQHMCYVILKWIKLHYLKDKNKTISSYHCKTALFYVIERNPFSIWVLENLNNCVIACLKILREWVLKRNCPNYFIPNENMFKRIENATLLERNAKTLHKLIKKDINIVIEFEDFQSGHIRQNPNGECSKQLRIIYVDQLSKIFGALSHSVRILRGILELDTQTNEFVYYKKNYILKVIEALKKKLHLLQNTTTVTEHTAKECRTAIDLVVPFIHTSIGSHLAAFSLQCVNVSEKSKFESLAMKHLILGMTSDLTSGRLKKISYLYILKDYDACLEELFYLWTAYKLGKVINVSCLAIFENEKSYNYEVLSLLENHDYTDMEFAQSFCSAYVFCSPAEINIMPFALQVELFKVVFEKRTPKFCFEMVIIDSQIYLYFLVYLISKKTDRPQNERLSVIYTMKTLIPSTYFVGGTLCLIAWAFAEEGFIREAILYLVISWKHHPKTEAEYVFNKCVFKQNKMNLIVYGKSVIWHMLLLLRRIWFTDYISVLETSYQLSFCFKCLKRENIRMKKCSICKYVRYCSTHCQKKDWKVHKDICKGLSQEVQTKS